MINLGNENCELDSVRTETYKHLIQIFLFNRRGSAGEQCPCFSRVQNQNLTLGSKQNKIGAMLYVVLSA